jgi:hypothetical protein
VSNQNRRCRVFEAGYWKDFKVIISKEQAKTFLVFSSTKKKKCKTWASTYLLLKAFKKKIIIS